MCMADCGPGNRTYILHGPSDLLVLGGTYGRGPWYCLSREQRVVLGCADTIPMRAWLLSLEM